ncbi:MAG TPA: T9SS type A sorting domain-containing protein [Lentimicrobium sp.]|nr:T9SS type A sorting domain-containing protein [Lentimicrobium sp.]
MSIPNRNALYGIFAFLLFFAFKPASAQEWIKYYGEGQNAVCHHITNTYDNGNVIGGMIDNYVFLWIVKTDVNGNILWNKKIGNGINTCSIRNIEQTDDGGYILCGSTKLINSTNDAYTIKLNPCAEIEWCKVLDTPDNYDMGIKVKPTQQGDFVLMGAYFATNPISNTSLFKFNSQGDVIWHQFYPLDSIFYQDEPEDLLIDDSGYLILTDRYFPDPDTTSPPILRHHFTKTDTAGFVAWDLIYGVNEFYYGDPFSLQISSTGDYYEAGMHLHPNMTASPAFIKISQSGLPLYDADIMSDSYWGGLSSIDLLEDSLLVMVGGYYLDPNVRFHAFFKSDTLGNLLKIKNIPVASAGYWDVCKSSDNKFTAVGNDFINNSWRIIAVKVNSDLEYDSLYTQPFSYDSLCPHPIVSETINPTCDNVIVKIDEPFKEPSTTQLRVFPNPSDNLVTVELPKYLVVNSKGNSGATTIHHQWSKATLQLIDLQGKIQMQQEVSQSTGSLQIVVSYLAAGMYQFRLLYQGKLVAGSKVMVK